METMNTLWARASEVIGALLEENLDSIPRRRPNTRVGLDSHHHGPPRRRAPRVAPEDAIRFRRPGRAGASEGGPAPDRGMVQGPPRGIGAALQNTMKLIHEEAANVLGWRAP